MAILAEGGENWERGPDEHLEAKGHYPLKVKHIDRVNVEIGIKPFGRRMIDAVANQ